MARAPEILDNQQPHAFFVGQEKQRATYLWYCNECCLSLGSSEGLVVGGKLVLMVVQCERDRHGDDVDTRGLQGRTCNAKGAIHWSSTSVHGMRESVGQIASFSFFICFFFFFNLSFGFTYLFQSDLSTFLEGMILIGGPSFLLPLICFGFFIERNAWEKTKVCLVGTDSDILVPTGDAICWLYSESADELASPLRSRSHIGSLLSWRFVLISQGP